MTGATSRVAQLLHADPAFASGATSFSSGLETLVADGLVTTSTELEDVMTDAIRCRWNTFERVFLRDGFAAVDQEGLASVDREIEMSMFGAAARRASRRAGGALLGTWARLGGLDAERYRSRVRSTGIGGHLPVAQAIVYSGDGIGLADAESLACWAVLSSYASGAVRLGVVGHRVAQSALLEVRARVAPLLDVPVADDAVPHAWTPLLDIAVERHSAFDLRLFAS